MPSSRIGSATSPTEHSIPARLSAAVIRRQPEVCRESSNSAVIAPASIRRRAWVGVSTRLVQA
jgi:hypothetical protein